MPAPPRALGGAGGSVQVTTPGMLVLDGAGVANTQIAASATGPQSGPGGSVIVNANALTVEGGAQIASSTAGPGNGGSVQITAQGPLTLTDPGSAITALATSTASGSAGSVIVNAPQISLMSGAEIASTTAGTDAGGSVQVTTPGMLVLDGAGVADTQIAASATGLQSGPGGSVIVNANALTVEGGAQIASSTAGPGKGGNVVVTVANGVTLSGVGPSGASGITASAEPGSSGGAGEIVLTAGGAIALLGGAEVTSSTAGAGNGGTVAGHSASAADPDGSGDRDHCLGKFDGERQCRIGRGVGAADHDRFGRRDRQHHRRNRRRGSGQVRQRRGHWCSTATAIPPPRSQTSAIGPQSGPGGSVTLAATSLTVEGGAQSPAPPPGRARGRCHVIVASGIALRGPDRKSPRSRQAAAMPGRSPSRRFAC